MGDTNCLKRNLNETKNRLYINFPSKPDNIFNLLVNVVKNDGTRNILIDLTSNKKHTTKERAIIIKTLIPYLLVDAKIEFKTNWTSTYTFFLTKEGEKFGKKAAEFTSNFLTQNPSYDLELIFGKNRVTTNNCCEVLRILYKVKSIRQSYLAYKLDEKYICQIINNLNDTGIIKIEKQEIKEFGFKKYKLINKETEQENPLIKIFTNKNTLTLIEIKSALEYDSELMNKLKKLCEKRIIMGIELFPITSRVDISLTEKGMEFFKLFCLPIYDIINR